MTRLITSVASLLLLWGTLAMPTALASASHAEFESTVFLINPCNGEFAIGVGPTRVVYAENAQGTHFAVHVAFKVKGAIGDQGNSYNMSFSANGQFDAPSGSFDNVTREFCPTRRSSRLASRRERCWC